PVARAAETLEDPWLRENGYLETWEHPRVGPVISCKGYASFARTPVKLTRPTPDIGEHTLEVLRDWGVAPDRIAALVASGAVFVSDGMGGIAAPR
ncbi:MAG: CoA transferase, partial [Phenylobacterium sp.]|nr:CoA transferase [Phenylobacterium sp.]